MWNDPRQPPGFRGHLGESNRPLIPSGSQPRMRGRHPFIFQGGPRGSNAHFDGSGAAFRDMDGRWEEDTVMPEDELHLWRARPNMSYGATAYRGEEVMDMRYRENPENDFRARLAPDMDYREREAPMLDQRGLPDVDYRCEEGPAIAYRERLQPPHIFREQENLDFRRRMQAEKDLREQKALEHNRQRVTSVLDILLQQQERQALVQRQKEDREAADVLRERSAIDYSQRDVPSHFQESADRDLRFSKPDVGMNYMDQRQDLGYTDQMVSDYSHNEFEAPGTKYTEGDYHSIKNSQSAPVLLKTAAVACGDLEAAGTSLNTFGNRDIKIPGIGCDTDYRETEKSDSDYRGRDHTDSDYRDVEMVYSDYRGKKSADSDYRGPESAAADVRVKKSASPVKTQAQPKTAKNPKALQSVMAALDVAQTSLPSTKQVIPFLPYDKPPMLPLPKVNEVQERPVSAAKREVQSEEHKGSFPGKLDVDFRDRPKPEPLTKETPSKVMRLSADCKEPCTSDQDLRSKKPAQGGADQDFRTGKYVQKDEDFRAGKDITSANVLKDSLLYDFLRLAAKELKQHQEKGDVSDETKGPGAASVPQKPPMARMPHPAASSVKSAGAPSPMTPFLGRQDSDYRSFDFNDVDLRVGHGSNKKSRVDPQPGSKDKDYRRTTIPEGASRIIWLDGLPSGASREDILSTLAGAHPLPQDGVNLIGYVPGYSSGSVCVEFSLVEEAVGYMEATKGVLHFKGKKINLKYKPHSEQWICQQCKAMNVLSKERCWQCSALRAGSDHLLLRDAQKGPKVSRLQLSLRAKKRKANQNLSDLSSDNEKARSHPQTTKKENLPTVIIKGISPNTIPLDVVTALQPYVQLSKHNVQIIKKKRRNHKQALGYIDLKTYKEAIHLTKLIRNRKRPFTIGGNPVILQMAYGTMAFKKRQKVRRPAATRKQLDQRTQKSFVTYPGYKVPGAESQKTGKYVNPRTSNSKTQSNSDDRRRTPERGRKESQRESASRPPRRGFTEDKDSKHDPFKRPLPPPETRKAESPPEPKDNPLMKLLGEYGDDSDEEEEELLPGPAPKPAATKPAAPKPAATKPAAPKPAATKPTAPKPAATKLAATKPAAPKPAATKPAAPKPALTKPAATREELTDWKKMICLLCLRQFSNKEALIRHKQFSALHKQNLTIKEMKKKSQNKLVQLEQEEDQSIQRRLLQARRELERLERAEESAQQ